MIRVKLKLCHQASFSGSGNSRSKGYDKRNFLKSSAVCIGFDFWKPPYSCFLLTFSNSEKSEFSVKCVLNKLYREGGWNIFSKYAAYLSCTLLFLQWLFSSSKVISLTAGKNYFKTYKITEKTVLKTSLKTRRVVPFSINANSQEVRIFKCLAKGVFSHVRRQRRVFK